MCMGNNSLSVKENNIFSKIKCFLKSLFYKEQKNEEKVVENEIKTENNNSFLEEIKSQTNVENAGKEDAIKDIVNTVEKNPETLNKLSMKQLKYVNKYYDKELEEVDKKINKLKKN